MDTAKSDEALLVKVQRVITSWDAAGHEKHAGIRYRRKDEEIPGAIEETSGDINTKRPSRTF